MEHRGLHPPLDPGEVGSLAKHYLPHLAGNGDRGHDEEIPQNPKTMICGANE